MAQEIEKLKQEVDKLKALLDDPQPGLISWSGFVDERIKAINAIYYGDGKKGK